MIMRALLAAFSVSDQVLHLFIYPSRGFPIHRSGALQETHNGSPPPISVLSSPIPGLFKTALTSGVCFCRFLIVWTSFLPFALFNQFQWLTPFVCAIVTFLLFGVRDV